MGITGAAYEMAALMSIRLATGWDPAMKPTSSSAPQVAHSSPRWSETRR